MNRFQNYENARNEIRDDIAPLGGAPVCGEVADAVY